MALHLVRIEDDDDAGRDLLEQLARRGAVVTEGRGRGTTLVLGGARSGKSVWAESELAGAAAVDYVATSRPPGDDAEWAERVALHRSRRPEQWRTLETVDVSSVLAADSETPVLVDCAAVWLDRVLADAGAWADADGWRERVEAAVGSFVGAVGSTSREVIVVSNEVGLGIVPATASGRLYRDELGRLNARLAAAVDEVFFCTAGIVRRIK